MIGLDGDGALLIRLAGDENRTSTLSCNRERETGNREKRRGEGTRAQKLEADTNLLSGAPPAERSYSRHFRRRVSGSLVSCTYRQGFRTAGWLSGRKMMSAAVARESNVPAGSTAGKGCADLVAGPGEGIECRGQAPA